MGRWMPRTGRVRLHSRFGMADHDHIAFSGAADGSAYQQLLNSCVFVGRSLAVAFAHLQLLSWRAAPCAVVATDGARLRATC
eukprot:9042628-Alexandrium_andersonii.AAC.1